MVPALEQLRELSHSPFPPEPPRRSRLVDALYALAERRGHTGLRTPHLHGGSDVEKVMYEYERDGDLWEVCASMVSPSILSDQDVIDVGCGWGGKTVRYAETLGLRSIIGVDLPGMYDPAAPAAFARERGVGNCAFLTGTAEQLEFAGESFGVAILDDVFEHVRDPAAVMAECLRVLRPGGSLILRFPSIRMLWAHHLDRVFTYPGLHYLLPFRTWASGLNYKLLDGSAEAGFEPFDEVTATPFRTPFGRPVTRNLNGQAFADFENIVADSGFETVSLQIVPMGFGPSLLSRVARLVYNGLRPLPGMAEALGVTIAFVGRKPASDAAPPRRTPDMSPRLSSEQV
ncbi:MAG TPA: class I SAM-dependent methyltransferase [Solirubrobacteraceae bacterium]|jgi:2-polyprenyl-3-methyl-5-hydroxy-6-metoxy-1,4-benzoquinol methylase|nr:class I SAM-dependent methyltransferase [Solirubrobacteraceae bacterium]